MGIVRGWRRGWEGGRDDRWGGGGVLSGRSVANGEQPPGEGE